MGVLDRLKDWVANEASAEQRAEIEQLVHPAGGALAAINAVIITGPQMRAAIEAIQHIQVRDEADAIEHGRILAEFAEEYGFTPRAYAAPALHARAMALDRWCHRYDPHGQTYIDAFFEAGARCPLVETEQGIAFEPEAFADLVGFIVELPY